MNERIIFRKAKSIDDPTARYPGFNPGITILPKGTIVKEGALPLPCDILFERDVAVPLRDGIVIYTNIFRPVGATDVPAIIAWSPYGKEGGQSLLDDVPNRAGVPNEALSGLEKWEGPDPAYWCNQGYALVHPDARGAYMSQGDIYFFGTQEGRDGHDVVEWIATRVWCNGKVGLAGNSWLGIAQWYIAAEEPPHLAAIAPWEGLSDFYRDMGFRGGIPHAAWIEENLTAKMTGNGYVEDIPALMRAYPLMNAHWEDKAARVERISIPAYVVASWTNGAHTPGTFGAFQRMASAQKWLRVHNNHEWPDLYQYTEDLRRFFDCYLKGIENGWETTPRVRLAILDPGGVDQIDRPEHEFPLARTHYQPLYLDGYTRTLSPNWSDTETVVQYTADEQVDFTIRFEQDTELTGYMKLHLWVEAIGASDLDLFVVVQKLDPQGNVLAPLVLDEPFDGSMGRLRVSHRQLDSERSTPDQPFLTHTEEQLLQPGQIVPVDIALTPMGMLWHTGQQLRVTIAGHGLALQSFPGIEELALRNHGTYSIHMGGRYDAYLQVPVIPLR
jgi:uncharacterized protein